MSGFAEAAILWRMKTRWGHMGVSPEYLSTTPLFFLMACLGLAIVLAAIAYVAPRFLTPRAAIAVTLALCAASVIGLKFVWLERWALAVVSVAIATVGSRVISSRLPGAARSAKYVTLLLAALTLIIAVTGNVRRRLDERRAVSELAAPDSGLLNVLLLVLDTVGADHLGLYGYDRPTSPQLDKWAARGVTFDRAIATAPWTLPSHGTMMTGLYPHEFDFGWVEPMRTKSPMLAEAFTESGSLTAAFVGNWIYLGPQYGIDKGFIHYDSGKHGLGSLAQQSWLVRQFLNDRGIRRIFGSDQAPSRPFAGRMNRHYLAWLDRRPAGRPFFAFVNYFDAHDPYLPPRDEFRKIAGYDRTNDLDPLARYNFENRRNATPGEIKLAIDSYDAAIAWQDQRLGELLDEMERRGLLDETVVIIVGDHGEEFGEHSTFYHGPSTHRQSLQVPLVILGPGVPKGVRIKEPVTLRDVAATVAGMSGLAKAHPFPGVSLERFWRTQKSPPLPASPLLSETSRGFQVPDFYPNAKNDIVSLVEGDLHFIHFIGKGEELFDWSTDHAEKVNLLDKPGAESLAAQLRTSMASARAFRSAVPGRADGDAGPAAGK